MSPDQRTNSTNQVMMTKTSRIQKAAAHLPQTHRRLHQTRMKMRNRRRKGRRKRRRRRRRRKKKERKGCLRIRRRTQLIKLSESSDDDDGGSVSDSGTSSLDEDQGKKKKQTKQKKPRSRRRRTWRSLIKKERSTTASTRLPTCGCKLAPFFLQGGIQLGKYPTVRCPPSTEQHDAGGPIFDRSSVERVSWSFPPTVKRTASSIA